MDPAGLLRVAHALAGVWFLAGLIGRWVTLAQAARATDIRAVQAMLTVSSRFERIVIVGSGVVLVLGIATAVAQGRPFLGPLQGARIDWLFASLVLYLSVLPIIPLVFLPRGRIFEAALAQAEMSGEVTEQLRSAFRDPVVFAAHAYELGVMVVVFVLMITRPF